jgi:S-ribosylhomocysteine lyase
MSEKDQKLTDFQTDHLGEINHTLVAAPYVRLSHLFRGHCGDRVAVYDIRITQPNLEFIEPASLHSLEHMLHVYLQARLPGFVNFAPMGCQTGFYLTTLNSHDDRKIMAALAGALKDVLRATDVPLANICQCGNAGNHNFDGAKKYAARFLSFEDNWAIVFKEL